MEINCPSCNNIIVIPEEDIEIFLNLQCPHCLVEFENKDATTEVDCPCCNNIIVIPVKDIEMFLKPQCPHCLEWLEFENKDTTEHHSQKTLKKGLPAGEEDCLRKSEQFEKEENREKKKNLEKQKAERSKKFKKVLNDIKLSSNALLASLLACYCLFVVIYGLYLFDKDENKEAINGNAEIRKNEKPEETEIAKEDISINKIDENKGIGIFKGYLMKSVKDVTDMLKQKGIDLRERTLEEDRKSYLDNVRTIMIYDDLKVGTEIASRTELIFYHNKLACIDMALDDNLGDSEIRNIADKISEVYGIKGQYSEKEDIHTLHLWTVEKVWSWSGQYVKTRINKSEMRFGETDEPKQNVGLECYDSSSKISVDRQRDNARLVESQKNKRKENQEFESDF